MAEIVVIGGGLAGSEAAWQAARRGAKVVLYEMRPAKFGPAHHTGMLAELVCSNSLRGASLENAVGLLKEELARLDSLIVTSAREAAVPAGGGGARAGGSRRSPTSRSGARRSPRSPRTGR
jgi:methylenetetrahydrofolate--tRNA-(uracil-5-)-methyltransferase